MSRALSFYACQISLTPNIATFLSENINPKTSQQFLLLLEELIITQKDFLISDTEIAFRDFIFENNRLIAGKVGLSKQVTIPNKDSDTFNETETQTYPNVYFLWDHKEQLFIISTNLESQFKRKVSTFLTILEKALSKHINEFNINIKALTEKGSFWDAKRKFNIIKKIQIELLPMNFFGKTPQLIKDGLKHMKEDFNISSSSILLENKANELVLNENNESLQSTITYNEMTGGNWTIVGDKGVVKKNNNLFKQKTNLTAINDGATAAEVIKEIRRTHRGG